MPQPRPLARTGRLVIVGPTGAGKTTILAPVVDDLHDHYGPVFGVAQTANATRVLERGTGVAATRSKSPLRVGTVRPVLAATADHHARPGPTGVVAFTISIRRVAMGRQRVESY